MGWRRCLAEQSDHPQCEAIGAASARRGVRGRNLQCGCAFLTVSRSDIVAGCQDKCGEDWRDASRAQRGGSIALLLARWRQAKGRIADRGATKLAAGCVGLERATGGEQWALSAIRDPRTPRWACRQRALA